MSFMGNCIIVYALINNYPFKPYSALLVTSYCAEKIVSACRRAGSAYAEMVGQGEVGGVTRRVLCTWQLLGFAVKWPWLAPIVTCPAVHAPRQRMSGGLI